MVYIIAKIFKNMGYIVYFAIISYVFLMGIRSLPEESGFDLIPQQS